MTIILLLDKSGFVFWGLFAAIIHELGHLAAFALFGNKPREISAEISGIKILKYNDNLNYISEIIVLFAGAFVNFITFFLFNVTVQYQNFAYIHLILGIFNLLPIRTLDGGAIIHHILNRFISFEKSINICKILSIITTLPLIAGGIFLTISARNFTLLITGIYLFIKEIVD